MRINQTERLALAMLVIVTQGALAEQFAFVGARATGMGGANSASAHDATAQWHNPAVFGFMNQKPDEVSAMETNSIDTVSATNALVDAVMETNEVVDAVAVTSEEADTTLSTNTVAASTTGTNLNLEVLLDDVLAAMEAGDDQIAAGEPLSNAVLELEPVDESGYNMLDNNGLSDRGFGWNLIGGGVGYTMTEDMGHYAGMLSDVNVDAFDTPGLSTDPDSVSSLLAIGGGLYGLSESGNALYVDGSVGSSVRFGHFAVGIRVFGEGVAYLDELDDTNLGIDQTQADFVTSINDVALQNGFDAGAHTINTLSASQVNSLTATLGNADSVKYIDFELSELQKAGTFNQKDIDNAVMLVDQITFDAAGQPNSLDNNRTTMFSHAFGVVEIPVSYGRAINDNLSLGITVKGMYGTVTGAKVWFFDDESTDAAFDSASENSENSLNFGLDLGLLYRIPNFHFSVVGHNLNSPKFSGFTDTITIEDHQGNTLFTEEMNVPDVKIDPQVTLGAAFIPNERFSLEVTLDTLKTGTLLNGYDIQRLSFGGEVDVWLLAFRLGAYRNLAAEWQDWVATAGVGLNLYAFRIDIGGAYGLGDTATISGQDVPTEARLFAGLSLDF